MKKLQAQIILEILGRPPEHIAQALENLIKKLDSEKGISVTEKIMHEPTLVKDSKDLYTAFAEITLELDSITNYFAVLFGYMPSNIELIYPEEISLSNFDLNQLANQITQRLHSYDAITKKMMTERNMILEKLKQVAPHLFKKSEAAEQPKKKKPAKKKAKKKSAKKPKKKSKSP